MAVAIQLAICGIANTSNSKHSNGGSFSNLFDDGTSLFLAFMRSEYTGVSSVWNAMLKMSSTKKSALLTVFVQMHVFNKQKALRDKDRRQFASVRITFSGEAIIQWGGVH